MGALARFVMQGRMQAALVAAACSLLALIVPPIMILSGGAVALVTLRRGANEGLVVLAAGALGTAALGWMALGSPGLALWLAAVFWIPLWVLAVVLRATVSLSTVLKILGAMAVGGVLLIYALLGDPTAWWLNALQQLLQPILIQSGIEASEVEKLLELVAPFMAGMSVANIVTTLMLSLFLARWWQAQLYNPGGFGQEFRALRLGRAEAVLAAALLGAAAFSIGSLPLNLALAVGFVVAVYGIAVVHGMFARSRTARGWLFGFYVLTFFFLFEVMAFMCALAIVDAWADLRSRVRTRTGSGS